MRKYDAVTKVQLRDRDYLTAYLQNSARSGPSALYGALREAVRAQEGGFVWLSKHTGLGRASLYKALSETGNPAYTTICRVLDALGVDWAVVMHREYGSEENMIADNDKVMDRGGIDVEYKIQLQAPKARILPGSAKGMTYYMAEDFNGPVEDFNDYC